MINLFNYEDKTILADEEKKKVVEYEKRQREIYGVYRKYYRWDLAKDFFRLTPKEFKEAYGFNDFYPEPQLFNKADMFVKGKINLR